MCGRHVRFSFTAIIVAPIVCLSCSAGFGDINGGLGRFFETAGHVAVHQNAGRPSSSLAVGMSARTAESTQNRVVQAGCDCRAAKSRPQRETEKLEPVAEPVAVVSKQPTKIAEPVAVVLKQPTEIAEPRLLPWWEEVRQSGFFPTPIVSVDLSDKPAVAVADAAVEKAKRDPPRRKPIVDPSEAKRRYFRDAVHVTINDDGVRLVRQPDDGPR